ncbi:MAG: hypothetical protein HFG41_12345 [Coprococcus sp.]|nr:hypothetical protein [Coprococcus sp.]
MDQITKTVQSLGIYSTYPGSCYLIDAVRLVLEREDMLLSICCELYPSIAKLHNTTPDHVERNIRAVVDHCWEGKNRTVLEHIFPYPIVSKPYSGEIIDALAEYCKKTHD